MRIEVKTLKRCEVVILSGEIDGVTAPELEERLLDLIEAGKRNLVLNFRDVTFISTAGLRVLTSIQIKAHRQVPRGEVVISEISSKPKEILNLVGFHHLFKFFERDVEAVGSF